MNTHPRTPARGPLRLSALAIGLTLLGAAIQPAVARDSYVLDSAGMFDSGTVSTLNSQIGDFNRETGKEIVVDAVPSLQSGQTVQDAAEKAFAAQQVNGVLIFIAKNDRQDLIVGDRASHAFFPTGAFTNIHDAMRSYFRQGDYNGGIKTGVNLVLDGYRSHMRSYDGSRNTAAVPQAARVPATSNQSTGGFHMGFFWLLIILLAGFLIIRALFRAMSGPRMMPPGGPGPGPGYGGPGYGGGYGYGGGGGGGNFFSGLLGGLGGAFLGNELFGNRGGQTIIQDPNAAGFGGGGNAGDASGWQSDAGQADMGNAGGGDWGGGGFDSGGGGDFGGGGGGDSGGGW